MLIRKPGAEEWSPAECEFTANGLAVRGPGTPERVELFRRDPETGEVRVEETLATLGLRIQDDGGELRCCSGCLRFRSGINPQQSVGGRHGFCSLLGARSIRGPVRVDFGCGEYLPASGWPASAQRAREGRDALAYLDLSPSRQSAFEGCLVGLAVGDALGFPAEFRSLGQIQQSFGPAGLTDFVSLHDSRWPAKPHLAGTRHPPGTFSDDTQMSVAVAQALLSAGGEELDPLMEDLAERLMLWSRSAENDRAPSSTCLVGCENLQAGVPWRSAGVRDSKGCGSAVRVAPIGLYFGHDHPRLLEVARASSLLTHRHPTAVESAAAAALLVALALEKASPERMLSVLQQECGIHSSELASCLARVPGLVSAEPQLALSAAGLGEGRVAEEAVACALYCFWRSPEDFASTVLAAANSDGDSDGIAAIAGSISGAFNGIDAIPARWRSGVEDGIWLRELASFLSEAAGPVA